MQSLGSFMAVCGMVGAALFTSLRSLQNQTHAADAWIERFENEKHQWACGRRAAYERNLAAAAAIAAHLAPDKATLFHSAATEAANEAPDSREACNSSASNFSVRLHQQRNPTLPPDWPNWVARATIDTDL